MKYYNFILEIFLFTKLKKKGKEQKSNANSNVMTWYIDSQFPLSLPTYLANQPLRQNITWKSIHFLCFLCSILAATAVRMWLLSVVVDILLLTVWSENIKSRRKLSDIERLSISAPLPSPHPPREKYGNKCKLCEIEAANMSV